MTLKAALLTAASILALSPAANAYEGLYGTIGAGYSYVGDDRDVTLDDEFEPVIASADYDADWALFGALGYGLNGGFRTEIEIIYRKNDARQWVGDGFTFSGFPEGTLDGEATSLAFMANVLYDFNEAGTFSPYIGAGAGMTRVKLDLLGDNHISIDGITPLIVDDGEWVFSYQGIAGLAIRLSRALLLDLSYRYFGSRAPDFDGGLAGEGLKFSTQYNSHNLFAGLRWMFNAGAPPQQTYKECWDGSSVPSTANCPPQIVEQKAVTAEPIEVIVYFDYDSSTLSGEAQNLIREAAQRALASNIQQVIVEGNADRSGSSAYNQTLSETRANVVRDALVANGVPADRVETNAFGEDNPAKPTEDGVREPLNRRTEVHIRFAVGQS